MNPMKDAYSDRILFIINSIYRKIFHEEISNEVENFIKNLSYVGIGIIVSSIFSFSYNILAGRLLGPSEYGIFTIVQSVAMLLYIPMLLGFHTAMVKYNAEKVEFLRQRSIISTTYILVLLFSIISIICYLALSDWITAILSISSEFYYFAILFAILFIFYTITTESLRSLHMIRVYSRLMPLYSMILLSSFLVLVYIFKERSFLSPLYSILIAYGITGGIILALLRKYLRPEFNKEWACKLHKYSIFSLMGGISATLYMNIDKIIINLYMPISNVGLYWAYHYSFTTLIFIFLSIFVTVFFPVASKCPNKDVLFLRLKKVIICLIIIGWPLALISGWIILSLYGGDYPFDISLALLFATAGTLISIDKLYGQLLSSMGIGGVRVTSIGAIALAVINLILNILLIPHIGITGAVVATIIGYISSISIMLSKWKNLAHSY